MNEEEEYAGPSSTGEFPVQEVTEEKAQDTIELTYEDRKERLHKTIVRQPLHREILYQVLVYAQDQRTLKELEDFIAGLPQFREATQPQYYLIQFLVSSEGLDELELDAQGNIVEDSDKEGLTEDEIDDLVETWAYQTTDLGLETIEEMKPTTRMDELLAEFPAWEDALIRTVDYLQENRKTSEVNDFLATIERPQAGDSERMQPSAFIDRLEKAGIIEWGPGWELTEDGRNFYKEYQERGA